MRFFTCALLLVFAPLCASQPTPNLCVVRNGIFWDASLGQHAPPVPSPFVPQQGTQFGDYPLPSQVATRFTAEPGCDQVLVAKMSIPGMGDAGGFHLHSGQHAVHSLPATELEGQLLQFQCGQGGTLSGIGSNPWASMSSGDAEPCTEQVHLHVRAIRVCEGGQAKFRPKHSTRQTRLVVAAR